MSAFGHWRTYVSNLPVFVDCDDNGLVKTAEACGEILSADDGL
jgi:hypothetical protein